MIPVSALLSVLLALQIVTTQSRHLQVSSPEPQTFTETADTIPVVVHVIHTGDTIGSPYNPGDSLITELLNLMNAAFSKNGPQYGGADMEIRFALATRGPDCLVTSGINRVDGTVLPLYANGGITTDTFAHPGSEHEVYVKNLSRWSNVDYLNIWIVNKIDGSTTQPGGFAYFPEYNQAQTDGLTLLASVVNGSNKTVIHELGHYFSLYHVFEDENWETECSENINCQTDGDRICDTEPCLFTTDCNETLNACTNAPWEVADPSFGYTVLNNYMGYTNCQWMFTEDQKVRVQEALIQFRPGLRSSRALEAPSMSDPMVACIPSAGNFRSMYYGIERFQFAGIDIYSNTSDADAAYYVDRSCNQRACVHRGDTVLASITGSYENWQQIALYIDFNNNGVFEQPAEQVMADFGGTLSDAVIIPLSTACGPVRMRVISENPNADPPTPCNLSGTAEEGVGQIEDYGLIVLPRVVRSLSSGDWQSPSTWSCACVPDSNDAVEILGMHTITANPMSDTLRCHSLKVETNGLLIVNGKLFLKAPCN